MFSATSEAQVVGLHIWYVQGEVAYGHLGAASQRGYELMASFALYAFAIEQLRTEVRWLALGGAAGDSDDDESDGLRRFKEGWATGTRQTYLCGKVLQPDTYRKLAGDAPDVKYFRHTGRTSPPHTDTASWPDDHCLSVNPHASTTR